jgi:hypothetical protein
VEVAGEAFSRLAKCWAKCARMPMKLLQGQFLSLLLEAAGEVSSRLANR